MYTKNISHVPTSRTFALEQFPDIFRGHVEDFLKFEFNFARGMSANVFLLGFSSEADLRTFSEKYCERYNSKIDL